MPNDFNRQAASAGEQEVRGSTSKMLKACREACKLKYCSLAQQAFQPSCLYQLAHGQQVVCMNDAAHGNASDKEAACVGEQEFRGLTPEMVKACEEACKPGGCQVADLDRPLLQNLHKKGLIHLDVPIRADDHVSIPPLEVSSFPCAPSLGPHSISLSLPYLLPPRPLHSQHSCPTGSIQTVR